MDRLVETCSCGARVEAVAEYHPDARAIVESFREIHAVCRTGGIPVKLDDRIPPGVIALVGASRRGTVSLIEFLRRQESESSRRGTVSLIEFLRRQESESSTP